MVAGTLASVLQTGPLLALDAVAPDLSRLNPFPGIARMFTRRQAVELLKSLAKIGLVGWLAWGVLRDGLRGIVALAGRDAHVALAAAGTLGRTLLVRAGVAMLAIAILDVFFQRWQFAQDQKMSKKEVEREHKESEGDPHTKQERERLRREILAHDVVENVRRADVLVVNPTHLAVALEYDGDEGDAPTVVAKGQDELARRMIEAAREAGVPVLRDVPLAHALTELDLGDEIPEVLYEAVAAVLKVAWAEREREEP
jgi:flagellar biosynthetic protein FlhB